MTGYAWATLSELREGMTLADVIGGESGEKPADGATDILLVGMDSRTDAQGNPLPQNVLNALRAGESDGELNTDTLILMRIPSNGKKATAISIPRDSYVDIPGHGQHKINSSYIRAKAEARGRLQEEGVKDKSDLEVRSNQEGAKNLIKTVENLSGATIDHYAEVNLLGFAEITKAVGGVDVCLNEAVYDEYSGADFPAGKQTISGAKALAFVRQRHGLLRGDPDRIVRQQVFMAGLAKKIVSSGTLTDQGKLEDLINAAKKSIVLDQGWDILSFAEQMRGLSGGQIQFQTIPFEDPEMETPEDGQAIEVDPARVQEFVRGLTGEPKKPAKQVAGPKDHSSITVNVFNASGETALAASVSESLTAKGFGAGETGNAETRDSTVVRHASGDEASATQVAKAVGGGATIEPDENLAPGQVSVLLGTDYQGPDQLAGQKMLSLDGPAPAQAPEGDDGGPGRITANETPCVN
ncbi:MAG: LytR family transcriptional regulator [Pseudonocardiaceae bacterium]|nr:LytR family transcriptional regulator [Pseudonocardiaceae bacterium]